MGWIGWMEERMDGWDGWNGIGWVDGIYIYTMCAPEPSGPARLSGPAITNMCHLGVLSALWKCSVPHLGVLCAHLGVLSSILSAPSASKSAPSAIRVLPRELQTRKSIDFA